jgi:radical SAM methylthiotransferase, MiaB/RimO family
MMDNKFSYIEQSGKGRSVAFVTLGCKLNFSETSAISRQFIFAGYEKVSSSKAADVYVINTCSVTEHADKKCRQTIRKLEKLNKNAIIVVTGCYAQLKPNEILEIEGVDLVVGTNQKGNIPELLSNITKKLDKGRSFSSTIKEMTNIFPAYSQGERTRSFLKIQDGCSYNCSYCTIPLARGESRSLSIDTVLNEARSIASSGVKEIVITGVNTGDFGRNTGEKFLDLLKYLNDIEGIERYRISSIEPNLLNEEIINWIASGTKFQNHFHIPLQSGCDKILALMRRRYNTKVFSDKISMIRSIMGDVFLV